MIVRGIPGSGKSYLAHNLLKRLGSNVELLDPDAIDKQSADYLQLSKSLQIAGVDKKLHPYRYLRAKAYSCIDQSGTVIWNQPFMSLDGMLKTIKRLQEYAASQSKNLRVIIVEVEIDHQTAANRVAQRKNNGGHGPTEKTLRRFFDDYRSFSDQGYETIVVGGGNNTEMSLAIDKVLKAISPATSDILR